MAFVFNKWAKWTYPFIYTQIQMPSLWLKHCSQNVYKGDGSRHQDYGIGGHIRPDLLRRSAHHLTNSGEMFGTQGSGYCNIRGGYSFVFLHKCEGNSLGKIEFWGRVYALGLWHIFFV